MLFSGVAARPRALWPCSSMLPSKRPTLSHALSATSSGYLLRVGQRKVLMPIGNKGGFTELSWHTQLPV